METEGSENPADSFSKPWADGKFSEWRLREGVGFFEYFQQTKTVNIYLVMQMCVPVYHMSAVPVEATRGCQITWNRSYRWL